MNLLLFALLLSSILVDFDASVSAARSSSYSYRSYSSSSGYRGGSYRGGSYNYGYGYSGYGYGYVGYGYGYGYGNAYGYGYGYQSSYRQRTYSGSVRRMGYSYIVNGLMTGHIYAIPDVFYRFIASNRYNHDVCFNGMAPLHQENGTKKSGYPSYDRENLELFVCPLYEESEDQHYCCGDEMAEYCCTHWQVTEHVVSITVGVIFGAIFLAVAIFIIVKFCRS